MLLLKYILFHYAILLVLYKYSFVSVLKHWAKVLGKTRFFKWLGKFFYNLSECSFCCHHLGGVLGLPLFFLFVWLKADFLLFPLMSTGAIFLLNKQIKE